MINGFGPAYGYLGYQVHTRKFFQALNRLEPVCLTPANQNNTGFRVEDDLQQMIARQRAIRTSDPAICIGYGNGFHCFHGRYRIGYTVFEYTRLADDWINGLGQVDEIWTTSRWGHEILVGNGLGGSRIGIVPEGFDPAVFHPGLRSRRKRDGVFRFLCVGKWENRKGQTELLAAWARAFRGVKDVELVLMCHNPFVPNFSVESEVARMGLGAMPPVRAVRHVETDADMAVQYAEADCFVLPTRAEGWGLPIMEAMACATPVITTRYSAMTDYATDANAFLLDVRRMVPVYDPLFFPRRGEAGEWAEIDIDQLAEHMLLVYRERDVAIQKGQQAGKDMAERWTWDHAARKAHSAIAESGGRRSP